MRVCVMSRQMASVCVHACVCVCVCDVQLSAAAAAHDSFLVEADGKSVRVCV